MPTFVSPEVPASGGTSGVPVEPAPYWATQFGQFRVASPYSLADLTNQYQVDPYQYFTVTAGGGTVTHIALLSAIRMQVDGAAGSRALLRTKNQYRYQAGKSASILLTGFNSDTGQANQTRRWGQFDDSDGIFFELVDTTLNLVIRTSTSGVVTETRVPQSSWSSNKYPTLDLTKGNIYEFRYQWLGVGTVEAFINGTLVHVFENANSFAAPYMRVAVLPLSWEVVNTGASVAGSYTYICASVQSDGGTNPPAYSFFSQRSAVVVAGNATQYMMSLRLKPDYPLGSGIQNRAYILPLTVSGYSETNRFSIRVIYNATLTNPTWAVNPGAYSVGQVDIAATAFAGGEVIQDRLFPGTADANINMEPYFQNYARKIRRWTITAADTDTLTLIVVNETAGNSTITVGLAWGEIK